MDRPPAFPGEDGKSRLTGSYAFLTLHEETPI